MDLENVNAAVNQAFTQLKSQVANSNLGDLPSQTRNPIRCSCIRPGNNFVMNGVMNNASAAKPVSVSTDGEAPERLMTL